jgi:hypothetical protein
VFIAPEAKLKLSSIVWRSTGIEQPNAGRQLQMMMMMKVSSFCKISGELDDPALRLQLLRLPSPNLLAALHFHQILLHNLIFFQEKERGIYIQFGSRSKSQNARIRQHPGAIKTFF